jgi:hypothetical protein
MPPGWNDTRELIAYVEQALVDLGSGGSILSEPATGPEDMATIVRLEERRSQERKAVLAKYGLIESPFQSDPQYATWKELEGELVPIAKSGNYAPLFRLLQIPAARAELDESTWGLLSDIGAGRYKRSKRRRQLTDAERFNKYRVHQATYLVPVITRMLRVWYPKRKRRVIKARAIEVTVAIVTEVRESTLTDQLRRGKRDRRRLPG